MATNFQIDRNTSRDEHHGGPAVWLRDETMAPLLFIAVLLLLDILFSSSTAAPGHVHMEPLDSLLKALVMLILAIIAYFRPVEFGAQLLERGAILAGMSWLVVILGTPLAVLALVDDPIPQLGLLASVICALIANIVTKFLTSLPADEQDL